MDKIVILGAGDFAREVAWLIEEINQERTAWDLLGYIDNDRRKHGCQLYGYEVLGGMDWLEAVSRKERIYVVCGVGGPRTKRAMVSEIVSRKIDCCFANLVHPSVRKGKDVVFGVGNVICAGTKISVGAQIKNHVTVNLSCTVGHDVALGDYCTLAPGVNLSGRVQVGEGCDLGTNCCCIQGLQIGEWSIVGAGAVVVKDLPAHCTAVGVPARPIKFHGTETL